MIIDYFSSSLGSPAQRLDKAWSDYQNEALDEKNRLDALTYMIYTLDIESVSNDDNELNKLLVQLMDLRAQKRRTNPSYIPIQESGRYQLESNARELRPTRSSHQSDSKKTQQEFNAGKLLDVNPTDKKHDLPRHQVTYLTPTQRAEYSLQIHQGIFQRFGHVFDSSRNIAHGKPGYVAFTLNTNGELSVFNHLSGGQDFQRRRLVHSSMNAGAPVLAAGEMKIRNGKLISINTFSGHYKPSLYSVALFLEYLSDRKVDISQAKVYLQNPVNPTTGLQSKEVLIAGDPEPWYEVSAPDLLMNVQTIMASNLHSINSYLNDTKTKLYTHVFRLNSTKAKVVLGKEFQEEVQNILDGMRKPQSMQEVRASLSLLAKIVDEYSRQHTEELSGKDSSRMGKKFSEMKEQIQMAREQLDGKSNISNEQEEGFKKSF